MAGAFRCHHRSAKKGEGLTDWIGGHVWALQYFGTVPEILVPDNLKTGVTNAHRYEPTLNRTYRGWAGHYGMAIVPAPPGTAPGQGQSRSRRSGRGTLDSGPIAPSAQ